ncbi:hypothetical protein HDA40_005806 [Hamadaea flava]|nr:hypothetical protein [Hamadaea flava]
MARPLHRAIITFVTHHEIAHVIDLAGWSGTGDLDLYDRAAQEGFHAILTNDSRQLSRQLEVEAIARSGLHRIQYSHKINGLQGLGVAIGSVCAGLPIALDVLATAPSQRLIKLKGIDPTPGSRLEVTDPSTAPPKFWPLPSGRSSTPA